MDAFRIEGGQRLAGRITIDGSKNAALPLMAAALLASEGESITLRGVPDLVDIKNMIGLLRELGCEVRGGEEGERWNGCIGIRTVDPSETHARYDIVRTMRASICVLGPLLAKRGMARVSMPGGCAFGARPVDLHLRGLEALGAMIELEGGDIVARAPKSGRLRGATVFLGGPFGSTVLGTANVMSAATLAEGTTIIESAACEPEITDLANMLTAMGAKISGAGSPRIVIEGVDELGSADHKIIADRIVAGTYAIAAAMTHGDVILDEFPFDCLLAVLDRLRDIGVNVEPVESHRATEDHGAGQENGQRMGASRAMANDARAMKLNGGSYPKALSPWPCVALCGESISCSVRISCDRPLKPTIFTTQPYPGFPTDLQAQMMTLLSIVSGNSIVTEKIYPERFMHVAELSRMGAQLFRQGPTVVVQGVEGLIGAPVMASDLRGSASLVLAGLVARGETTVSRVYHLDRGYVRMEETLRSLGAIIERFNPVGQERLATPELIAGGV